MRPGRIWKPTDFNSRPCERGFLLWLIFPSLLMYFNSRPCERGFNTPIGSYLIKTLISIHAPARGASASCRIIPNMFPISIHAPARGASQYFLIFLHYSLFQFTPLREGLHQADGGGSETVYISIHAPARGASVACVPVICSTYFNSRPCERGFVTGIRVHFIPAQFQFTPLRKGLQQKPPIFLSVFCCFLSNKYIFTKLILSNPQFNQYRPHICAIFIAPISWDFMYWKYMRKVL